MRISLSSRLAALGSGLSLLAVGLTAAPASATEDTVISVTLGTTTAQEGGLVTGIATVRTGSGAPVTSGTVLLHQGPYCESSPVALDARGSATVPFRLQQGGSGIHATFLPDDERYGSSSVTVPLKIEYLRLPTAVTLTAHRASSDSDVWLSSGVRAREHWSCSPENDLADGDTYFYEGTRLLGSGWGGAYQDADLFTPLTPGTHQIRTVFVPRPLFGQAAWTTSSTTATVTVTAAGATASPQLVTNPSFESDVAGWAGTNATISRLGRSGSPDGAAVAKVTRTAGSTYGLTDTSSTTAPTVRATSKGAAYVASASVAAANSSTVGKPLTLVLSERTATGALVRESQVRTSLGAKFKRVTVAAKASADGNTMGVRLAQGSAATGHAFLADALDVGHAARVEAQRPHSPRDTVWTNLTADAKRASRAQTTATTDVTAVVAQLDGRGGAAGSQAVKGVIYSDVDGAPGARLATTRQVVIKAGAPLQPVELALAAPLRLPAGSYWIGLHSGPTGGVARYLAQESAGGLRTNLDAYTDGATRSFGGASTGDKAMEVHLLGR